MPGTGEKSPRAVALIGPYGSGKTTLLESLLFATGAIPRKGSVSAGNCTGDGAPEARARQMGLEVCCATTSYLQQHFTFLDCPGSVEFLQETLSVLPAVDTAVVVIEPEPAKVQMVRPYLKRLADMGLPHILYVNKIEKAHISVQEVFEALQGVSDKPLLLRQIPTTKDGKITGFIDLALERGFIYREHAPSEVVGIDDAESEQSARFAMLEKLADYDELLMEELISDIAPKRDRVFDDLTREMARGEIVPVLIGSAENDNGIRRLLKALRHEAPPVSVCAGRSGIAPDTPDPAALIFKTSYASQGGKLSLARILSGTVHEGDTLCSPDGEVRIGSMFTLTGDAQTKCSAAEAGDVVALSRLEGAGSGMILTGGALAQQKITPEILPPVYRLAVRVADRKDEVKLMAAIAKLCEEDPSLSVEQDADLHQTALAGQGEIHLRVAAEKMTRRYGLNLTLSDVRVPYRESIRGTVTQRGRHKRQSGGHGQFGDVVLDIAPLPRGTGFVFQDQIVGGVVPKQWIPSVEKGVKSYLECGPLGFPVEDLTVTLTDGSFHTVDSSDAAFQTAARVAMAEGLPKCNPVLLEPVMRVTIHVPSDATSKVNSVISARRGQIFGFDSRNGWAGWDSVTADIPQSEIGDLVVELRSLTQGLGTFEMRFDHLAELNGKLAEAVVTAARQAKESARAA